MKHFILNSLPLYRLRKIIYLKFYYFYISLELQEIYIISKSNIELRCRYVKLCSASICSFNIFQKKIMKYVTIVLNLGH